MRPKMDGTSFGAARDLEAFTEAEAAFARVEALYDQAVETICRQVRDLAGKGAAAPGEAACYPFVGIEVSKEALEGGGGLSYGQVPAAGVFGTTLTRPQLFKTYYLSQFRLLLQNHGGPLWVGVSERPIPVPFVVEAAEAGLDEGQAARLAERLPMPDL